MPDEVVGDAVVYLEWEPPPAEIAQSLIQIADYVDNVETLLIGARRVAMDDMEEHFTNEVDPYGVPWAPLNPVYREGKIAAGYSDQILVRTGDLKSAATDESAWEIIGNDLVFDSGKLPDYGIYHQYGRAAKLDPVTQRASGGMPAREFIGLSDDAEAKIDLIFEAWTDEATLIWIHPATGYVGLKQPAGSPGGIGGQFAGGFFPTEQ